MSHINVNWTGASGAQYLFEVNPVGTPYKCRPGVYIMTREVAPGQWQALYVGETDDFDDRLNSGLQRHDAWPRVCVYSATHMGTLHVTGGTAERLRIETDLRHGLRPPCNLQ